MPKRFLRGEAVAEVLTLLLDSRTVAERLNICIFGLGEAGSLLSADLLSAGAEVNAFDPAETGTPDGVERFVHPALAVRNADLVLSVTGGAEAKLAMLQSLDAVRSDAVYADLSTASPALKNELAAFAGNRELQFADVALMASVPGLGLETPCLVAGSGAERCASLINDLGGRMEPIEGPPGAAAAKKLIRSVMMKGTAAVLIESLEAGAAIDDIEWLWENLTVEITSADRSWLRRLVTGSKTHAGRRIHEMQAAEDMLDGLSVPAPMTRATIESLNRLLDTDPPELPFPPVPADLESSVLQPTEDSD
jgi:3-hydroxyisobutyrate dehydrogenase-like beta-hydroxyacid dehydrogenase